MASTRLEVSTISHLELEKFIRHGEVYIVDVRDLDFFVGHIPGARHIPVAVFDDEIDELARQVSVDAKPCVVTCLTGEVRSTACAIQLLMCLRLKFGDYEHDVRVLKGGFVAWEKHFATKNVGGHYISRIICLEQYSQFGLPTRKPSKRLQIQHPASSRHHAEQIVSCGAHLQVQQKELYHKSVEKPSEGDVDQNAWRSMLSVGDIVQVRHCGSEQWSNGVITETSSTSVLVCYFHENRNCVAIVALSSPDLQPVKAMNCRPCKPRA